MEGTLQPQQRLFRVGHPRHVRAFRCESRTHPPRLLPVHAPEVLPLKSKTPEETAASFRKTPWWTSFGGWPRFVAFTVTPFASEEPLCTPSCTRFGGSWRIFSRVHGTTVPDQPEYSTSLSRQGQNLTGTAWKVGLSGNGAATEGFRKNASSSSVSGQK